MSYLESAYKLLPEHGREPMKLYIEKGIEPGSFLTAVLSNNLIESFGRADSINSERIRDYCQFLYQHAPRDCWGSLKRIDEWIIRGGIDGILQKQQEPVA